MSADWLAVEKYYEIILQPRTHEYESANQRSPKVLLDFKLKFLIFFKEKLKSLTFNSYAFGILYDATLLIQKKIFLKKYFYFFIS